MILIVKKNNLEAKIYHQKDRIVIESDDSQFQQKIQDMVAFLEKDSLRLPWGETIETEKETIVRDGYRIVAKDDKDYLHALAAALFENMGRFGINIDMVDEQGRIFPYHPLRYFIEEK